MRPVAINVVPLTKSLAEEFSTMPSWEGERSLQLERLRQIDAWIDRGEFNRAEFAYAWYQGRRVRMNGQHTSNRLSLRNGDFPKDVLAVVQEYRAENREQLYEIFKQFDTVQASRTAANVVGAQCAVVSGLAGVRPSIANRLASGILWNLHRKGTRKSVFDRAAGILEDPKFVRDFAGLVKSQVFQRVPMIAAMHATYQTDPAASIEWWAEVTKESAPFEGAPSRVLARYLTALKSQGKDTDLQREIFAKCIYAWNAHRDGRQTIVLRYSKRDPLPEPY